ncbi:MAG: 50S ribosomal protein L21 [Myxococcales bacterium]|nr:50S ribosomal protein L21 [Myxococcales bacterium]
MANYAIIRTGGKQYRAEPGAQLTIEKIDGDRGGNVVFDDVLLVRSEDAVQIGAPVVAGAAVKATIVEQTRDKKVLIHKHKRRKKYRKTQGHRQYITRVRIDEIVG